MKKIISLALVLAVVLACFNLGISFVSANQNATKGVTDINILDEKTSTFEGGQTGWKAYSSGTVAVVNNPLGEGKVLKYTHTGVNTWQSPSFDLRPFVEYPGRIYISFDLYSEDKNISASFTVRTNTANILSACTKEGGKHGPLYNSADVINNAEEKTNSVNVSKGSWKRVEYVIDITQADIDNASTDAWTICFDGLKNNKGEGSSFAVDDVFYIDNVMACYADHAYAEKTEIVREAYTKVGAIRWDAYSKSIDIPAGANVANYTPASQVANTLSPAQYHYQAPFFATVTDSGKIAFPEYTVKTWEQEAIYAHEAGLDYFSYLWYETTSEMSQPRKMHLQSEYKNLMQMTGILESIRSNQTMNELFEAMKDPCWLRLSGRPVLFLYDVRSASHSNGAKWTQDQVDAIRRMAYRAGITESLYIIGMNSDYTKFDETIYNRGMDAVSLYSYSASAQGEPYDNYTERLEKTWEAILKANPAGDHQVIPIFSAGRDCRPRIDTAVSWIDGDVNSTIDSQKPYGNKYTLKTDIPSLQEHIATVYNYTQKYADKTQPNLICSYAWNEHDEGGWLCPTLNCDANGNIIKNDPINNDRLEALKEILDSLREGSHIAKPTQNPDSIKTVYNGDAESGIQNWGNIHGGSYGYVQPGANGTNNAIRFIPSVYTGKNDSIAFNVAPAIINDSDYNLAGCGAGYYNITFWAKANKIPAGSTAVFSVGFNSQNHLMKSTVAQYTQYSDYNTFINGADGASSSIKMTEEWQKFSVTIKVEEDWLKMLKELRESNHTYASRTYDLMLRLDGSGSSSAFGSINDSINDANGNANGQSYEYYIDELTITHATSLNGIYSKLYPTPTPVPAMPTPTPKPAAIPANSVINYLEYEVNENGVTITGSKMDIRGDIIIPYSIENKPVTEIGEGAFRYRAQLTKVTLPETVTKIGDFAFEQCANLKSVVMDGNVTEIGTHAFCGCSELEGEVVLSSKIKTVEPFAFHNCNKLVNVKYLSSQKAFADGVEVKGYNEVLIKVLTYKANDIAGATLNVGTSLNIDYYAYFEADASRITMRFTNENGAIRTVDGVYDQTYELYRFTYTGINPQCMTDTIKAELLLDGETVLAVKDNYSVKAYCDSLASKSAGEIKGVKNIYVLRKLLAATLIYGKEAQINQNYKLDDPADASSWINSYKTSFVSPVGVKVIEGNQDRENCVKSASLNMANVNRVYFRLVLTDENVVITLNDELVDKSNLVKQQDGTFILYSEDIKATDFDKVFTLKLIKADETITTVQYNLNAYIQAKYSSSSVGAIVQALNNYGVCANNYQDMLNGKYKGDYDLEDEDDLLGGNTSAPKVENLIPAISSNFNNALSVSDTAWIKGAGSPNILEVGLADDGNGGKCIYYTRGQELSSSGTRINYDTIAIDLSKYIKAEGDYVISFRYKIAGDSQGNSPFSGVIRSSGGNTSFTTNGSGSTAYGGVGGNAKSVVAGKWETFEAKLHVKQSDIGIGGKWNFGVQTVNDGVTAIYFDDVVVKPVDYEAIKEPVTSAETWYANEAVFVSNKWYEDAYHDVTVDLKLTNGHVTYTIPCFWDGGLIWRARFVCPSVGTWTYTTECSDQTNKGLNNQTSTIECIEYTGAYDIYKHGFVTAKYNNATRQKYFTYADGTPFFYLGDTHWNFDSEPIDAFKTVVNKRTQQGFTVYQSESGANSSIFHKGFNSSSLITIQKLDEKFQYVAEKGLVHANSQFFFPDKMDDFIDYYGQLYGNKAVVLTDENDEIIYNSLNNEKTPITVYGLDTSKLLGIETAAYRQAYLNDKGEVKGKDLGGITVKLYDLTDKVKEELKLTARYWVARYSAYPVMWTLGQEVDDDFMFSTGNIPSLKEGETEKTVIGFGHAMWGNANNPYKLVAQYMSDLDPYSSPITAHQETANRNRVATSGFNNIFNSANKEVHTWYASQFKTPFNFGGLYRDKNYNADINETYERAQEYWNSNKVAVNYEGYYDRLQTKDFGARAQGWMAYLNGMFGYGWGAQGTWQYGGSYGDDWAGTHVTDGADDIYIEDRIADNDWQKALNRVSAEQMGYMRKFFTTTVGDWYNLTPRFGHTNFLEREAGAFAFLASNSDRSKVVVYFCNYTDSSVAEFANTTDGTATGKLRALKTQTTYNYIWFNPITGAIEEKGTFYSGNYGTYQIGDKKTCDMVLYVYI